MIRWYTEVVPGGTSGSIASCRGGEEEQVERTAGCVWTQLTWLARCFWFLACVRDKVLVGRM